MWILSSETHSHIVSDSYAFHLVHRDQPELTHKQAVRRFQRIMITGEPAYMGEGQYLQWRSQRKN